MASQGNSPVTRYIGAMAQTQHAHTEHHDDHGSTPAAWTTVIIIMIAFVVGTLAVVMGNWVMFWVAAGLVVLGAIIGGIMKKAGLGKKEAATA